MKFHTDASVQLRALVTLRSQRTTVARHSFRPTDSSSTRRCIVSATSISAARVGVPWPDSSFDHVARGLPAGFVACL